MYPFKSTSRVVLPNLIYVKWLQTTTWFLRLRLRQKWENSKTTDQAWHALWVQLSGQEVLFSIHYGRMCRILKQLGLSERPWQSFLKICWNILIKLWCTKFQIHARNQITDQDQAIYLHPPLWCFLLLLQLSDSCSFFFSSFFFLSSSDCFLLFSSCSFLLSSSSFSMSETLRHA